MFGFRLFILCSLLSIFTLGSVNSTTEEKAEQRIRYYTDMLIDSAPPYVWGGAWGFLGGDCSGQTYWVYKLAGMPYPRTNSLSMWNGAWPGMRFVSSEGAREEAFSPALIFFDYSPSRPRGHVGIVRSNEQIKGLHRLVFAEASSSKKYFKETEIHEGDFRWKHTHGILIPDLSPGF